MSRHPSLPYDLPYIPCSVCGEESTENLAQSAFCYQCFEEIMGDRNGTKACMDCGEIFETKKFARLCEKCRSVHYASWHQTPPP